MGELPGRREEGRLPAAASSRAQMPAQTTPEQAASSTADFLYFLAGDAQLDPQGSAHLALIRDLLEPFAAGRTNQALTVICQRVAALMGVPRCSLCLWDEPSGCLVLAAQAGPSGALFPAQPAFPTSPECLPDWVREMERLGSSMAPPRPSRLQRRRRRARSFPDTTSPPWDAYPVLGIPLSAAGRAIGFLFCVGIGESSAFTERHIRLGNILAATLAPAIGAAWANRRDPPVDTADVRSARLALSGSLDPDEVLQIVTDMARERLGAQVCVALSFQDAHSFRVCVAAEWENAEVGIDLTGDGLASQALRLGRPVWIPDRVRPPRILPREIATRVPLRAGIAVPLREGDQVTGAILAYHSLRRDYSAEEVRLLASLAAQAGAALRNCVLYERQRLVAETVQRALAPRLPPIVEGVDVGHLYLPKADQIGGDHYDLIPLGGGRLGIAMGDVAGSGLRAAIHTTMARYMARAFAFETPRPGTILQKLNEAICTEGHSEVFLTLFCGVLHSSGRLHYANGAHPYPILRRAGRSAPLFLETTGTVVGVIPDQHYDEREVRLHSGDILLLYTDGVTEAEHGGDLFGFERLEAAVQEWQGDHPQELVDHIARRVREFAGGRIRDDLALLAIRWR